MKKRSAFPAALVRRAAVWTMTAAFAFGPAIGQAHHGWGDYDDGKPMNVKARVAESNYANPHASVKVDIDGKRWTAILAPISRMEARGATRESVAVGQDITLVGYPSRSTPGEMRVERLILGNDKTVELR